MVNLWFTDENKTRFAVELLKNRDDPFKAANAVFSHDARIALQVSREWPDDPFVLEQMAEYEGEVRRSSLLPSKDEYALKVWETASSERAMSVDDRLKAYKLFGEIMNYIQKPEPATTNVNIDSRRVMLVKDSGSDEDWEAKIERQQLELVANVE